MFGTDNNTTIKKSHTVPLFLKYKHGHRYILMKARGKIFVVYEVKGKRFVSLGPQFPFVDRNRMQIKIFTMT